MALTLFGAFTYKTFKKEAIEFRNMKFLLISRNDRAPVPWFPLLNGGALFSAFAAGMIIASFFDTTCGKISAVILAFFSAGLLLAAIAASPRDSKSAGRYIPDMALIGATLAFGILLSAWQGNQQPEVTYRVEASSQGGVILRPVR
jgi:hypothetical protein